MMSKGRCISKPFKRVLFSHADHISNKWFTIVYIKYEQKYIKKYNKLNNLPNENTENINGLDLFLDGLYCKLVMDKSLAHSKVREYWLRRIPRLLTMLLFTLLITISMNNLLIENINKKDNLLSFIVGFNLILLNLYMIYQRLIDSISCSYMRIGHVQYNLWKQSQIIEV